LKTCCPTYVLADKGYDLDKLVYSKKRETQKRSIHQEPDLKVVAERKNGRPKKETDK